MTLEQYLQENYSESQLEELSEEGCNWGGDMTRELYNEYTACIWQAVNHMEAYPTEPLYTHTAFARHMLSYAVRYYAGRLLNDSLNYKCESCNKTGFCICFDE